ncbi:hypothetical protein PFICI_09138 [Pestalotiopsis fici W106-1]|uniref:Transcription factor domain-containing protein n=1 Tax=Pestalotiopsis fici (strain W106-1 / CGMCC3.15140) TaxID=1229662 RepID=W3WZM0_PESFW|nr:uncharacterized protein PFICI_09138 [Pestalotiopsis fici W106-1]ETS79285.1 hypothetical protein PFICI_09138 [Pestalotiopsis fici W106-1]
MAEWSIGVPSPSPLGPSCSGVFIGPNEQEALYYFETIFARWAPKTFIWSACAVLLSKATNDAVLIHLLFAGCMRELVYRGKNQSLSHLADFHFREGSRLLIDRLRSPDIDHAHSLMAFWLLQLYYRAHWDEKGLVSMQRLSASMATYAKQHQLLRKLRESCNHEGETNPSPHSIPLTDRAVMCQFLIFVVYEDVSPDAGVGAGNLSKLVLSDENSMRAVFAHSRNGSAAFFRDRYPPEELLDDIERSKPLELIMRSNILLYKANEAVKDILNGVELLQNLLPQIHALKIEYSGLFLLADTLCGKNPKMLITTLQAMAIYYALWVHVLDSIACLSTSYSRAQEFDEAQGGLRRWIFQLFNFDSNVFRWRWRWPANVALATTTDEIHRDWLLQKRDKDI